MATKSMTYDHAAYLVPYVPGGRINGNAGAFKFAAYTAMLVKSVTAHVRTVGTSATDVLTAYKITGSTTSTQIIGTFVGTTVANTNVTSTFTLAQGDTFEIVKGADATIDFTVAVECNLVPGANVTA